VKFFACTLILCTLLFLAACGGDQTETPGAPETPLAPTSPAPVIPTTPAGWAPYSRSTYQIALPDSWEQVKLEEQDLKSAIATAQENNPPLAEQLRALLESGQYKAFTFYAVEKQSTPILRNVSITRVSLQGTNDLQAYMKAYVDALPNVIRSAQVIEMQAPLRVNNMNAASIVYDVSLVDNAGTLSTLRGVQFLYRLDSGDAYLVTVTGDAKDAEKFMPLAREIAASFVGMTP
jgi:hypothetical protein